jgi:hypothetical protein
MKDSGTRAIQFVVVTVALDRNDPPYHLAGFYNPITSFQRVPSEKKERSAPVSPLDLNDAMGNDAILHPIEDNISFLDLERLHRLNLDNLSIFDGRIHTVASRLETNTGTTL